MDPQQPVTEVGTLAQVRADNRASPRLTACSSAPLPSGPRRTWSTRGKGWMRSDG